MLMFAAYSWQPWIVDKNSQWLFDGVGGGNCCWDLGRKKIDYPRPQTQHESCVGAASTVQYPETTQHVMQIHGHAIGGPIGDGKTVAEGF